MSKTHDKVRAWAKGMYPTEAGAELLIRAGRIYDGAPCVKPAEHSDDTAWIDVEALLDNAGAWSGGEQRIVRIAASLLSNDHPVDLNDAVTGIDREHVALVLAAIAHANGSHEHSGFEFKDGKPRIIRNLPSLYEWPEG